MADSPISGLPAAATLTGIEPVAIVQSGVTVQTTVADIATVVLVAALSQTLPFTVTDEDIVEMTSGGILTLPDAATYNKILYLVQVSGTGIVTPAGSDTLVANGIAGAFNLVAPNVLTLYAFGTTWRNVA